VEATENRVHTRAQFFRINAGHDPVAVFAFRAQSDVEAIPALVVDLSGGGVQILSNTTAPLEGSVYNLELVPETPVPDLNFYRVQKVWSRLEGLYVKTGFEFASGTDEGEVVLKLFSSNKHHLLRCVLHPLESA
jgi:c-di-GMP-binding flagellar brake protein YcgR